jgi:predicted DNA binding protein
MKLRKAKIGVRHKGCWGSLCTLEYPNIKMEEKGPINVIKQKVGVRLCATWDVQFKNKYEFESFLKSLQKYRMVTLVKVINMHEEHAMIKTEWINKSSSYDTVLRNNCLYTSPVTQAEGYEIYDIITENPHKVVQLIEQLDEIGEVKVFEIGRVTSKNNPCKLSDKQSKALQIAVSHNFYEWPRKVSLDEVAAMVGMKRRTFQENLRKAEAKVIPIMVNNLFGR